MTSAPSPYAFQPAYGGFWRRFGAYWVDAIIFLPLGLCSAWFAGHDRLAYYFSLVPSYALAIFVHIYCVQRWGGSPGKLACRLRIVRTDLQRAGWREAWLRHAVMLLLSASSTAVYVYASSEISDADFARLSFLERSQKIVELGGTVQTVLTWLTQIWVWSEFLVLLTNERRRAIHDFIAGTVVIRVPAQAALAAPTPPELTPTGSA